MAFPSPFTSATPALDILQLLGYDESLYEESDQYPLAYGRKQNVYLCDQEEPEVSFITPSLASISIGSNDKTINPPILSSSDPLWSAGFVEEQISSSNINIIKDSDVSNDEAPANIPFIEFSLFDIPTDNDNDSQDLPDSDSNKLEHNICIGPNGLSHDKKERFLSEKNIFSKQLELLHPIVVIPQHLSRKQLLANSDTKDSTSDLTKMFKRRPTDFNRPRKKSINGANVSQLSNEKERPRKNKENPSITFPVASPETLKSKRIPSYFQDRLHKRKTIVPYDERQPFTDSLEGFDPYPDLY